MEKEFIRKLLEANLSLCTYARMLETSLFHSATSVDGLKMLMNTRG